MTASFLVYSAENKQRFSGRIPNQHDITSSPSLFPPLRPLSGEQAEQHGQMGDAQAFIFYFFTLPKTPTVYH